MRIRSPRDFWAGVMFIAFGAFFVAWSFTHYAMGSALRMGPGYFPALLGGLLVFLGLLVMAKALALDGPKIAAFHFRPLLLVSLSVVAYGYLMKPGGLAVATIAAVFIGALAGHEFKWKEVAVVALVLVIFSWLVFVRGLTLPFPMCPQFIDNCPIR
ncbi:MAG: tripartite tricarboxylate transporter TctB family protein [Betaproteobacteria bacterium]|nr:tripartite tricarboxylate transporter TctB family protein [Betaproteobacteria bacterium]MDH5220110.1 tripartite tricarboxylate transporter TctB family protein [Betaproteobacteria bacterium]MDH5350876.1 tripartite tricarboxylate transporter TctB family protein [Betaproteobacteria bacterium]